MEYKTLRSRYKRNECAVDAMPLVETTDFAFREVFKDARVPKAPKSIPFCPVKELYVKHWAGNDKNISIKYDEIEEPEFVKNIANFSIG